MENNNSLEAFNSMPVSKAVIKNAIPAMIAMLMVLIYNLADTFLLVKHMMLIKLQQFLLQHQYF